jgi:hypothetical protein
MLGWDRYGFDKKHIVTPNAELVFLHPVVSPGHIVHFGASGARNIDALYFMLRCDWCDFHKKRVGQVTSNLCFCIRWDMWVTYCIQVHPRREISMHYFSCSCGTGTNFVKSALGHVTLNLCFAFSRISGSRSALRCIQGANHRHTIFLARVGPV